MHHGPQGGIRVRLLMTRMPGLRARGSSLRFRISGFGFRISGLSGPLQPAVCKAHNARTPMCSRSLSGFGFRVSRFGFRTSRFAFRVSGFCFLLSGFGLLVSGFRGRTADASRRTTLALPFAPGHFRVSGFGYRVSGIAFRDFRFGVLASGFGVGPLTRAGGPRSRCHLLPLSPGFRFRASRFGHRVSGIVFRGAGSDR